MEHATRLAHRYSFIIFFGIFGLIALVIYSMSSSTIRNIQPEEENNQTTQGIISPTPITDVVMYLPSVANALITVPDTLTQLSLVDGRASYGTMLDGGDVALVGLIGGVALTDTVSHVFADVAVQSGGTGVFHYVLLFEVTQGNVQHLSSYFVGDRVKLISASLVPSIDQSYTVRIDYFDRALDQAFVEEPTIPKELLLRVRNGILVENDL